ncbi:CPBP family intramembrane metalloprotease [candidate division WOR-3 bacterium]|nr:CPBP family intramembrane metalloprotease [candidate division WOR-3 bacterium]
MKKKFHKVFLKILLAAFSILSFIFFAFTLPKYFPIANIKIPPTDLARSAEFYMKSLGYDLSKYDRGIVLKCEECALSYCERTVGIENTLKLIDSGSKLLYYEVYFKKYGESEYFVVSCVSDSEIIGWRRFVHDDITGDSLGEREAFDFALNSIPLENWRLKGINRRVRPHRTDWEIVLEREIPEEPKIIERAVFNLFGSEPSGFSRDIYVPSSFSDSIDNLQSREESMTVIGYIAMSAGGIFAFVFLIKNMNKSENFVKNYSPVLIFVSLCWFATIFLEQPLMFASWNPLWLKTLFFGRWIVFSVMNQIQILVLFVSLLFAGYIFAVSTGNTRDATFNSLFGKSSLNRRSSDSIVRGFFVGMLGGGIFAALCLLFVFYEGHLFSIQPRGFYLYILNSKFPALSSGLYFLLISVTEEIGYRHFGIMLTRSLFKSDFLAILSSSLIYGLTHSALSFLPPEEPFWGRAAVMMCIGVFWALVYLKYDLLTVITAHYISDLFIFNLPLMPRSSSHELFIVLASIFWPLIIPSVYFISLRFFKSRVTYCL